MRALLAVDLNEAPEALVAQARPFVEPLGAVVDLVYVDRLVEFGSYIRDPELRGRLDDEVAKVRARLVLDLEAVLLSLPEPLRGTCHVLHGDPAHAVLEHADGYDLLIVGTHGRKGLTHLWLGTLASSILRQSPVPVLVLRQPTS